MIVVGVDPGIRRLGFSVVEIQGRDLIIRDLDVLHVDKISDSVGDRLEYIHEEVGARFRQWNPRWVGLEKAVNFKNVESAFKLTEARGVIRLACHQHLSEADSRVLELSPTAIKKECSGSGSSSKESLQKVLKMHFPHLDKWVEENGKKLTHDAYDALAIAWTTWKKVSRKRAISARSILLDRGL